MARFTIQLPAELAGDGTGTGGRSDAEERTGANERTGTSALNSRAVQSADDELDAATRGFVAWVECWAGA
ncbi:hypothetical protein [Halosimplex halobium]|uniref:hypothetical protein n=1 Tax=Halosimplex halobium TaxID=3396618 RepID=UPI003F54C14E